jgi:hypothetical protein
VLRTHGSNVCSTGNADYINKTGIDQLTRRDLRNHLEARDLSTEGTRLGKQFSRLSDDLSTVVLIILLVLARVELIERLRASLVDEQLHKFAYVETVDTEFLIQAEVFLVM